MQDIYEMLNIIDIDESEFEEIAASEIEKEKVKKNLKKSINKKKLTGKKGLTKNKKISAAAAILFICISSAIVVKPALASNIPIIGELFKKDLVRINDKYANYIDIIGKKKSCQGIDVTFESAVADNNKLFLNFIVKNNNKEIKDDYMEALLIPTSMKINGKSASTGAGASWECIDKNTIRVLKKINLSEDNIPNKMNIDISISELFGKSGDWGVRFLLDKSKQAEKTCEEKINTKLDINGVNVEISTVTISPLTVTIKGEGKFNTMDNDSAELEFIVLDDKGNGLCCGSEEVGDKWTLNFISNQDMKNVTIIPAYKTKKNSNKLPPLKLDVNNVKPIELINDKDRSVLIKDYFIDGDYLIIRYNQKYFGKESLRHPYDTSIYVMAEGSEAKEVDGNEIDRLPHKYDDLNGHIRIFNIGKARNLMVGTYDGLNTKILKDKKVTVNTKK